MKEWECVDFLTEYSNKSGLNTYDNWMKLFEFLNMKYMDGVVKDEYGKPIRVGYPEEFQNLIAQEGGEKIKLKKVQTEIDWEYSDFIKMGNASLANKEYNSALEHFTAAQDLKPNEQEPIQKVKKIKGIIDSINKLHETEFSD